MQSGSSLARNQLADAVTRRLEGVLRLADEGDLIGSIIDTAWQLRASDIHLDPMDDGAQLRLRVDGVIHDVFHFDEDSAHFLTNQTKVRGGIDPVALILPEEGRWSRPIGDQQVDIRLSAMPCLRGEKLAMRLLDRQRAALGLDDLGLSEGDVQRLRSCIASAQGLVACIGPTGGGKTTTIYAMLHELVKSASQVVTIENPPEYAIPGVNQIAIDEQRGLDFATGLPALLRLDADFLVIGEVRDEESALAAVEAAGAGRGVLCTMHARDPVAALTRLRHWGCAAHELASVLSVIIGQRLLRRLCSHCRQRRDPPPELNDLLHQQGEAAMEAVYEPHGCERCDGLGYSGRIGIFEVWFLDEAMRMAVNERTGETALRQQLNESRHRFLRHDAVDKLRQGVLSLDEVQRLGELLRN